MTDIFADRQTEMLIAGAALAAIGALVLWRLATAVGVAAAWALGLMPRPAGYPKGAARVRALDPPEPLWWHRLAVAFSWALVWLCAFLAVLVAFKVPHG